MVSTEEMKRRLEERRRKGVVEPPTPPMRRVGVTAKYCPTCNREYNAEANFCEECGTKLEEKVMEGEAAAPIVSGDFIVVTANYIPGYNVVKTLGLVYGITVRSRGIGGQISASLRAIGGGEIKEYVTMMEHARQEAIDRMIIHAKELGANAIISARFDSDSISNVMQELLAYGTAVITEKEE